MIHYVYSDYASLTEVTETTTSTIFTKDNPFNVPAETAGCFSYNLVEVKSNPTEKVKVVKSSISSEDASESKLKFKFWDNSGPLVATKLYLVQAYDSTNDAIKDLQAAKEMPI